MTENDKNIIRQLAAMNLAVIVFSQLSASIYQDEIKTFKEMRENLVEFMDDPNFTENWDLI